MITMRDTGIGGWECPHCDERFDKPAEGEDGLGVTNGICPGGDRRTTYPATRRPIDALRGMAPDGYTDG